MSHAQHTANGARLWKRARELVLKIEVLHSDGKKDIIMIHDGDSPEHLAETFVETHGLSRDHIAYLSEHIRHNLEDHLQSLQGDEQGGQLEAGHQEPEQGLQQHKDNEEPKEMADEAPYDLLSPTSMEEAPAMPAMPVPVDPAPPRPAAPPMAPPPGDPSEPEPHDDLLGAMKRFRQRLQIPQQLPGAPPATSSSTVAPGDLSTLGDTELLDTTLGDTAVSPNTTHGYGEDAEATPGARPEDAPELKSFRQWAIKSDKPAVPDLARPQLAAFSSPTAKAAHKTTEDARSEQAYNRIKSAASRPGDQESGRFKMVAVPSTSAGASIKELLGRGNKKGGSTRRKQQEYKRQMTFDRLHKDNERILKQRERERQVREHAETKYMIKHKFQVRGKSSTMAPRDVSTDFGERFYEAGLHAQRQKESKQPERQKQIQKAKDDWTCPKCGHTNGTEFETCQRVTGRTAPLDELKPTSWVHLSVDKASVGPELKSVSRRSLTSAEHNDLQDHQMSSEVIRCAQARPPEDFMPTNVSSLSRRLIKAWRRNETVWETLHDNAAQQAKKKQLEEAIRTEVDAELTLHPQIPRASIALVDERRMFFDEQQGLDGESVPRDHGVYLHDLHATKVAEQNTRAEQEFKKIPFKPDIGNSKFRPKVDESQQEFSARLTSEHAAKAERLEMLREQYLLDFDPETGVDFFQPVTGRAPETTRRPTDKSIHDALHEHHDQLKDKLNRLRKTRELEQKQLAQKDLVDPKSREMLERVRANSIAEVYRTMLASVQFTNREEGVADAPDLADARNWKRALLDVSRARPDMLAKPMMRDLVRRVFARSEGGAIAYATFFQLMENALDKEAAPTGNAIAPRYATDTEAHIQATEGECTFKPKLDARSRQLAKNVGRDGGRNIVEVLYGERDKYHSKREAKVKAQEENATAGCTFKPDIIATRSTDGVAAAGAHYNLTRQMFPESPGAGPGDRLDGDAASADGHSTGGVVGRSEAHAPETPARPDATVVQNIELTPHSLSLAEDYLAQTSSLASERSLTAATEEFLREHLPPPPGPGAPMTLEAIAREPLDVGGAPTAVAAPGSQPPPPPPVQDHRTAGAPPAP